MTAALVTALKNDGVAIARRALSAETVRGWRAAAEARYREVDAIGAIDGPWVVGDRLGVPFVPTASSLGLSALGPLAREIATQIQRAVGGPMEAVMGTSSRPLLESAWLRRQFAPGQAPTYHAPHAWHQDGGLGFDYLNDTDLAGGLLPMVTCWCPLVACGRDAPGLAYLPGRRDALLSIDALSRVAGAVEAPDLMPGDVLLFTGDVLHRTHARPEMTRDRVSVEVRYVPVGHPGRRGPWSASAE
jgi:hypothetical protein